MCTNRIQSGLLASAKPRAAAAPQSSARMRIRNDRTCSLALCLLLAACDQQRTPEQVQADLLRTLPGSELPVVGLPISFDGQRPHPHSGAPRLGQHNDELLG